MVEHKDNRPIGFFDSGVGGLTVLKKAIELLPHESYIYIGDTANIPYGTKSPDLIAKLASEITHELLHYGIKALVVACNTASAVAISQIRSLAGTIPVIDVIDPTVRHALQVTTSHTIAVIGTEATIASGRYETKIKEMGRNKYKVISKATPSFVPFIEENPHTHPLIHAAIHGYLKEFKNNKDIKTLILGCTHYPMIKNQIQEYLGQQVLVIDSAEPTAYALKELLTKKDMLHRQNSPTRIFFTSDDPSRAMKIAQDFLGGELELQKLKMKRSAFMK